MTRKELWYWLLSLKKTGTMELNRLFQIYDTPEKIWNAGTFPLTPAQREELVQSRNEASIQQAYRDMTEKGIRLVTVEDEEYPKRLKPIYDSPYGLFVKGSLPREDCPSAAIIGARKCTPHGKALAIQLGRELAEAGFSVISGMAAGIDGAGHQGALEAKQGMGKTFAVLGCGPDICYPRDHMDLYLSIAERGGIISEYPPGVPPLPQFFPQRNRIISGLADLIIIVEAREKSGTFITVDFALEQGKDVMAVPGRPDDPLSIGCNRLIREGASIYTCVEDILSVFQPERRSLLEPKILSEPVCPLNDSEQKILQCLTGEPMHIDGVLQRTGIPIQELLPLLLNLELKGCIRQLTAGQYQKCRI